MVAVVTKDILEPGTYVGETIRKIRWYIYLPHVLKKKKIRDSVLILANEGYKNIELSGGTNYYDEYVDDLLQLKKEYNLNYLIHNYFPPPKKHIVINFASLNDDVYEKSIKHAYRTIELAKILSVRKIGFHAGFLIDPSSSELGKPISLDILLMILSKKDIM